MTAPPNPSDMAGELRAEPGAPEQVAPEQVAPEIRNVDHIERKAALLLLAFVAMLVCAALYLLYARGAFEPTRRLTLTTDDSEGVTVGMDLTYSGFPIGRVSHILMGEDGQVQILVDVVEKEAHWLRQSSVYTLERGIVGAARLRAFTGMLDDAPLEAGATRPVLRGDLSAEIPRLVADARDVLSNANRLTSDEGALNQSLVHLQTLSASFAGPHGVLGGLTGNPADAKKVIEAINNLNTLLVQLQRVSARVDQLAVRADAQVFGKQGVVTGAQETVRQLNATLGEVRQSLKRVDGILNDAQAISGNARAASGDLDTLRADVEASLRKVDALITELNRTWPFAPKEKEVTLP